MIRSIAFALLLAAGAANAGEHEDCYNDTVDADSRYTSTAPEVLQVTDADIAKMLADIRADEQRASMLARAEAEKTDSD